MEDQRVEVTDLGEEESGGAQGMIRCRCGKTVANSMAHPVTVDDGRGFYHYLYLCGKCFVAWIGAEKRIREMIDWIPTGADLKDK